MTGMFDNMELKYLTDTLNVNCTHVAMMTKKFVHKLLER
jgi:short-subunit dehydrogenase